MTISLKKGEKISLEKVAPGLKRVRIETTWDKNVTDSGEKHDLDGSVVLLNDADKAIVNGLASLVWYNTDTNAQGVKASADGAIIYSGDNQDGDGLIDETITIELAAVSDIVKKIAVLSSIDRAAEKRQNFGQVKNAKVVIFNDETNERIADYDLSEDASTETALNVGSFYRHTDGWRFAAIGTGFIGGLGPLLTSFGLDVE
jgi:tellurium resistance protein TerD